MASLKVYDGTQWVTIGGVEDHGQLTGLGDNDHPQYHLISDFNAFSAAPFFSSITFSAAADTHVLTEGQIAWNDDKKTLDIQTGDTTTLQVGQEQVVRIRNSTGNTLPNGTAVYVSGVQGEKLLAASAVSTELEEVQYAIGITTSQINNGNDGFMTTFGHLNGINTDGWTIGDLVYISPSAGILTNIPPVTPPNHPIRVGIVEREAAGDGRIFVSIDKGDDIHELHDVIGTNPQFQGQILYWHNPSSAYLVGGHESISGVGTNTHAQIDSHIASASVHFTEGSIDHTNIANVGTNTHAQLDSHVGSSTVHFTEASIDHTAISNTGTNTHAQIDSHIASASVHFSEASIDHTSITNVGSNSHTQIDSHIGSSTVHFIEGDIDHTAITNVGTNSHTQIDNHIGSSTVHFTEASIDHTNIATTGTNTHAQIDNHIASGPAHSILLEKSITIESPTDTDTITIMNAVQGYDINSINTVLSGITSPSAAWSLYKGSDRTSGTLIIASGTGSLTGETIPVTGSIATSDYLWIEITSVAGTIDTLHISMHMEIT